MRLFVFAFCVFLFAACSKNETTMPSNSPIVGKWNLVTDSIYPVSGNAPVSFDIEVYSGKAGDYWEFTAAGKLYTREDSLADSANYFLQTDSTIRITGLHSIGDGESVFQSYPSPGPGLFIHSSMPLTLGGYHARAVHLIK